jgi:ferritin-like metal-binding protein YciE
MALAAAYGVTRSFYSFDQQLLHLTFNPYHQEETMPARTPRELFVLLLSDVRQGTEKAAKIYQEIGQMAEDSEVKEALEARAFVSEKTLATLDQCFKLIGEKPVKFTGRIQEIFVEDFRKQFAEIEGPVARKLFILAKLNHLTHLRIGEYVALVAAADLSGHYGVGVLLESCLADRLAFVERTRRLIRNVIETRVAERKGAERAA